MGARLAYDSTRLVIACVLFFIVYAVILPLLWPPPRVDVKVPARVRMGEDFTLTLKILSWHPNYAVRQVSFAASNVDSTALAVNRPFVPVNILERERVKLWSVGFADRLTWPRRKQLTLSVPLAGLVREGMLQAGELHGSIDVVVDHTRVTMKKGYPSLTQRRSLPFSLLIGT